MFRKKKTSRSQIADELLSSIRKGFFVLDEHWKILFLNEFAFEASGGNQDKTLGANFFEIFSEWGTTDLEDTFRKVGTTGRSDSRELYSTVRKDWYYISIYAGETGLLVHLRKTTESKKMEEQLKANQKLLLETGQLARVGGWEIDLLTDTLTWSQVTREIHEVDDDFIPDLESSLSFYSEGKEELQAKIQKAIEGFGSWSIELPMITARGNHIWTLSRGRGEFVDGKCVRLVGAFQDITPLKMAEKAKVESENKFKMAIDLAPYPAMIHREDGVILFINHQWTEISGYTHQEIQTTREWTQLAYDEDAERIEAKMKTLFVNKERVDEGLSTIHCKDGHFRKWNLASIQLEGTDEGLRQVLSMAVDVTEKMELEARVTQANKMESIGQLAGGIAHDFNNLLMGIMNYAELASQELQEGHIAKEYIEEITSIAERSAGITEQLLAFARKQTIQPECIDINEAATHTLKMLRSLIGESIELRWVAGENLWPVRMDPSQFDQILANLAVNARDAVDGVGKLIIETSNCSISKEFCSIHPEATLGDYVLLRVGDNGCGIEDQDLEKIFEPFYTSKANGKGTGLGLATVYGIISQNNGFILVQSNAEDGTTFNVYLPKDQEVVPDSYPETEKVKLETEEGKVLETIFLAEDELSILKTLESFLTRAGYRVLSSPDPLAVLHQAEQLQGEAHLLITDVVMPKMNGKDLSEKIIKLYPDIKVLFISGYTANIIEKNGVLQDNVSFLAKPFTTKTLGEKVRELIDKTPG